MRAHPAGHLGVFTTAEAHAAGWSRSALAHAAASGRLVQVRRGVWAPTPDPDDPAHRARSLADIAVGACLQSRDTAVSHLAAATVTGLPTWAAHPRPCVTTVGRSRIALAGVHTHRTDLDVPVRRVDGVLVTGPVRTVGDIAREFGVEAGLVTADAAVRAGVVTARQLRETTAEWCGSGATAARLTAALVDGRAESPLESRSRWQIGAHDLPAPRPQAHLFTRGGVFLGRVDFFWEDGVVGEVDGSVKYRDDAEARVREKWRQERLERTGLLVVRWGARDLLDFRGTAAAVRDRLVRVRRPGWPRQWTAPPESDV